MSITHFPSVSGWLGLCGGESFLSLSLVDNFKLSLFFRVSLNSEHNKGQWNAWEWNADVLG